MGSQRASLSEQRIDQRAFDGRGGEPGIRATKPRGRCTVKSRKSRPNRRAFLRTIGGLGIGLPFLEGLSERSAFAQAAGEAAPTFGMFICTANGVVQAFRQEPEKFWPTELGPLTTAGMQAFAGDRATGLLADYADRLLIVRGVNYPFGNRGCGHALGLTQCLTAAQAEGTRRTRCPRASRPTRSSRTSCIQRAWSPWPSTRGEREATSMKSSRSERRVRFEPPKATPGTSTNVSTGLAQPDTRRLHRRGGAARAAPAQRQRSGARGAERPARICRR